MLGKKSRYTELYFGIPRYTNAKVSFVFVLICLASIGIWIYFKDIRTAAIIFLGYAIIRILGNFFKREPRQQEVYYE